MDVVANRKMDKERCIEKRLLGRRRSKWKDNINVELEYIRYNVGLV
jgi:hypothetical protein